MTRKDKIRNEHIGGHKVDRFGQKIRQSRLRWHGHAKHQDEDYVGSAANAVARETKMCSMQK